MPVQPISGYGGYAMPMMNYGGGLGGLMGGDGWLIILLLLLCGNGMWGGFGGLGGMMWPMMMGGMGAGMGLDYLYPWLNNSEHISDGFRDQQLQSSVNGIQNAVTTGFGNVQNALCQGFAGTTAAVTGAQNAIAQQLYGNEIANLNRSFAEQTANAQGFNGVNSGIADVRYTLATEGCATRANETQNTQTLLTALQNGVQSIKDQLCQDKIDAKNDEISNLRQQIAMKDLAASQTAQNAFISNGFNNEIDALYNRLSSCPIPAVPVYGRQNIFTCPGQVSTGCGCSGNAFMN
jgi:hypothetical protein